MYTVCFKSMCMNSLDIFACQWRLSDKLCYVLCGLFNDADSDCIMSDSRIIKMNWRGFGRTQFLPNRRTILVFV
jgi:hypothetical protein